MLEVKSIREVENFQQIALDLSTLLSLPRNDDISIHFPGTVKRYTGDVWDVVHHLEETTRACVEGEREQFIAFVGGRAVGMSIVTNQVQPPEPIKASWPNLSGFILNPYRSIGLGKLSIERRLQSVHDNFGGHAWTYVRKGNIPAERMVTSAGFTMTDAVVPGQEHQHLYLYNTAAETQLFSHK